VPRYANAAETRPATVIRKSLRDRIRILPSCGRPRLFWQEGIRNTRSEFRPIAKDVMLTRGRRDRLSNPHAKEENPKARKTAS
jgi:hypothetical protein